MFLLFYAKDSFSLQGVFKLSKKCSHTNHSVAHLLFVPSYLYSFVYVCTPLAGHSLLHALHVPSSCSEIILVSLM